MTKNPLSLMVFDRDRSPRKEAIAIMNNKNFNNLIFVSIIVNCLLMAALYDPLDETKNAALSDGTDVFFTFLFMFEMFVKIVALGLLFGEEAYLRNGWNILDGIVVIISFVCLDFVSARASATWCVPGGSTPSAPSARSGRCARCRGLNPAPSSSTPCLARRSTS